MIRHLRCGRQGWMSHGSGEKLSGVSIWSQASVRDEGQGFLQYVPGPETRAPISLR